MSQRGNTPLFPLDLTQRLMTEQRLYRTTSAQVTHTIERNAIESFSLLGDKVAIRLSVKIEFLFNISRKIIAALFALTYFYKSAVTVLDLSYKQPWLQGIPIWASIREALGSYVLETARETECSCYERKLEKTSKRGTEAVYTIVSESVWDSHRFSLNGTIRLKSEKFLHWIRAFNTINIRVSHLNYG